MPARAGTSTDIRDPANDRPAQSRAVGTEDTVHNLYLYELIKIQQREAQEQARRNHMIDFAVRVRKHSRRAKAAASAAPSARR